MPGPAPQPCPHHTHGGPARRHADHCPAKGTHGGPRKDAGVRVVLIVSPAQLTDDATLGALVRAKVNNRTCK